MPGNHSIGDLGIVDLEEESLLSRRRITLLSHLVAGSTDLHEFLRFHSRLLLKGEVGLVLGLLNACR